MGGKCWGAGRLLPQKSWYLEGNFRQREINFCIWKYGESHSKFGTLHGNLNKHFLQPCILQPQGGAFPINFKVNTTD